MQRHDHPRLLVHTVHADDLSWVTDQASVEGTNFGTKTRYCQVDAPCTVAHVGDGALMLAFPEAQRAVTSGQPTVLYDGEVCLGGGIISAAESTVVEEAIA